MTKRTRSWAYLGCIKPIRSIMKRLMALLAGIVLPISTFAQMPSHLDDDPSIWFILGIVFLVLFCVAVILAIAIGLYLLVAKMAERRNRSAVAWLVVSFFIGPIFTIVLLLCLGESKNKEQII